MALPGVYKIFNDRWAGQTVWCISDTHFGDEDLRAGIPNRPSDEELVRRINAKVGRKDTLIVLGDVGDIEFAKKLRGYKVLVAGNHDCGLTKHKEVFNEVYEGVLAIGEKLLLSHEPIEVPWACNFHGHDHQGAKRKGCYNFCADVIGYEPMNFNQFLKSGHMSKIQTIHRTTIDSATIRKAKRGGKKIAAARSADL